MAPAVRLLLVPAACIAGALGVYSLPPRARRAGLLVTASAAGTALLLLLSVAPDVQGAGVVERTFPTLIRGVPLAVRGDGPGVTCALLAAAAAVAALAGRERTAIERAGLLLCLAGAVTACLAASLILLAGGLELADLGALLLGAAAAGPGRRRAMVAFGVQHAGGLALLGAAVALLAGSGTDTLSAIPPGALSGWAAGAWAAAGALRLGAPAALPAGVGARGGAAWLAVAAVPGGLITLLRLDAVAGGGPPTGVVVLLAAGGLTLALGGAITALLSARRPAAVGRALLCALGGQVVVGLAVQSAAAATAAAAVAVALVAAALAAPAWSGRLQGRSGAAGLALLMAGGVPLGAAGAGLVLAVAAETTPGSPRALVGMGAGVAAAIAAIAAGRCVQRLPGRVVGARTVDMRLRVDVGVALAASAVLALAPGMLVGGIADRISDSRGTLVAIDVAAVRGPGAGWPGGYLAAAALVLVALAWSVTTLAGRRTEAGVTPSVDAEPPRPAPVTMPRWLPAGRRVPVGARRLGAGLGAVDRWLIGQPDLPVVCVAAVVTAVFLAVHR